MCMSTPIQPKLLPCSHTFCQRCLEGIVRNRPDHDRKRFPCPVCREFIKVPDKGVAAFKNNIYISTKDTAGPKTESDDTELRKAICENHPETERRPIELYCSQCQVCLCWKCKNIFHLNHPTEHVAMTAERMKVKMNSDKNTLQLDIDGLKKHMGRCQKEQQDLRSKREAVRKNIESRHKLLIAMADRFREEALFSLDTVTAGIESQLPKDHLEKTVDDLERLCKRLDTCRPTSSTEAGRLLMTAQKIYRDLEAKTEAVQMVRAACVLTAGRRVSKPSLNYSVSSDLVAEVCRNFLGTVVRRDWEAIPPVIKVREQFRSEKGRKQDIFSLMATADKVYLSYDKKPTDDVEQEPDMLSHAGQVQTWRNPPSTRGKTSFTLLDNGSCGIIKQVGGCFMSYAKSRRGLMLQNDLNGTAALVNKALNELDVVQAQIEGLSVGADSSRHMLQVIQCGPHRSFDVHPTEPLIAVVEEPVLPSCRRSVVLFYHGRRSVYRSPVELENYQPSDVCFHKLAGRDVLLVADEVNDAIHVVDVQTGKFLRYLAPECPKVIQPTALNVDTTGRLWVACRGGTILVCKSLSGY